MANYDEDNGIEVLKRNKKLLRTYKVQELFDGLTESNDRRDAYYMLTEVLRETGKSPLDYMDKIPSNMFDGWGAGSLIIPRCIDKFEENAFKNSTFSKIKIPEGIRQIPRGCFSGCSANQILVPVSCKIFAPHAFEGYEGIIVLPKKSESRYDNISFPKNELDYYQEHVRRVKSSGDEELDNEI